MLVEHKVSMEKVTDSQAYFSEYGESLDLTFTVENNGTTTNREVVCVEITGKEIEKFIDRVICCQQKIERIKKEAQDLIDNE